MNKNLFTYKKSGVNIDAADKFVKFISKLSPKKQGKKKFKNIGGFGSISDIPKNIKRPKIVACTDGVGTKIEIANLIKKYDTIGIDLVAMSVNDSIILFISFNPMDSTLLKSFDLTNMLINLKNAFLKPLSITKFLLNISLNGSEISISST